MNPYLARNNVDATADYGWPNIDVAGVAAIRPPHVVRRPAHTAFKWIGTVAGVSGAILIALNLGLVIYGFGLLLRAARYERAEIRLCWALKWL
jgi:hypothetical protein